MELEIRILRYNTESDEKAHWDIFHVEALPDDRILDVLLEIKSHKDGSLAFRYSCAHGVCGSDAMIINGENKLAVEVYRFSDGSYLEGQDTWRVSGMERDVYVYSMPKVHITDFFARAGLDLKNKTGIFKLSIDLRNKERFTGNYLIRAVLTSSGRRTRTVYDSTASSVLDSITTVQFKTRVQNVIPWSAEDPHLYLLQVTLTDPYGKVVESFVQQVGFKRVEIKNGNLLLNGKVKK